MLLVNDLDSYTEARKFIAQNEILSYDVETTGLNPRKDKIIGFGVSNALDGFYVPVYVWQPDTKQLLRSGLSDNFILQILTDLMHKKLLMFNASFDARFTKYNFGIDLVPALYADVLLLKHTCDEDFPFGLKEIATKLWGTNVQEEKREMLESIKANNGTAKEYYKASTQTLAKYCVQDCLLTYRIYDHYLKDLRRQKLEAFYFTDEVLPLYKQVTIPMEEVGVRLDIPLMQQTLSHINHDIYKIEDNIQAAVRPLLTLVFEPWFLNKDYPLLAPKGKPSAWTKKHATQVDAWLADAKSERPFAGSWHMFNLQSKHHLKKLFFDTMKLKPLSTTPTGLPQVDEQFMDSIKDSYDWVQQLIVYNKLQKIKSTYIERMLEESEDGRFYPSFMQHRTVSGRYSGDLQQLPRPINGTDLVARYTSIIRQFIIPDNDCLLVSADYEQLEPSIFAHTSNDKALQDIFNKGLDFYSEVALKTERLSNVSSDKKAPNYLGLVSPATRQRAKAYALGIAYGMTGYKLQFELGVPHEQADELVAAYLAAFPDLHRFMAASQDKVRLYGSIASQAGRVRHMPRCKELFAQYGTRLADSLHLWQNFHDDAVKYTKAKEDRREYINYLNNAINFQIQSLAASIVSRAGIKIVQRLKQEGLKARLVMSVHDEWVLNVPKTELDQVCTIVKDCMENIMQLSVPLRTAPQYGDNYAKCK